MPQQPNIKQLMQQVQQMQAEMTKAQESLAEETVDASAGGGMVKVKVSGDLAVQEITIDPDAVDPTDVEMLQDMVLAAINEANRKVDEAMKGKLGGMLPPGLGGLLG